MMYGVVYYVDGKMFMIKEIDGSLWNTSFNEVANKKAEQFKGIYHEDAHAVNLEEVQKR